MENQALHRFALFLAACTLVLVVAGASVTSNEAGLSVPDWPLSYGKVMPEMRGGVFYEHGHRMIATAVGILTIILAVWISKADSRPWMKTLGWAALAAVILQGILGGLTVLYLLPPAISVAHACLAQLFFSLTAAIALFTSKSWRKEAPHVKDFGWPSLRSLAIFAPVSVVGQIALGAAFRHQAMGVLPHILGAMFVALVLLIVGAFVLHQFPEHPTLKPFAVAVMAITLAQIFLGVAAFMARMGDGGKSKEMLLTTVAHVAGGGLTLASTVLLSIQIRRNVRGKLETVSGSAAVTS